MTEATEKSPLSQQNWKASLLSGAERLGTYESEIYSDSRFIGALEAGTALGPYSVVNLIAEPSPTVATACLVLRVHQYLSPEFKFPPLGETDSTGYHGGTPDDEIAALLALAFGCRLQVGPLVRVFDVGGDPFGRRRASGFRSRPAMGRHRPYGFVLPRVIKEVILETPQQLKRFAEITAESAFAVVLAARLYQSAIWVAEADPNSAWLMLVSALEVAAGSWALKKYDSISLFKEFEPELAAKLMEAGEPILKAVAKRYGSLSKAAKKFREFVVTFAPDPPPQRPTEAFQINWEALGKICDAVYGWRSSALHAGTPFPLPLCMPPFADKNFGIAEKPTGLGSGSGNYWWEHDDTFVLLNTFEYIARGALLNWWLSLVPASPLESGPPAAPPQAESAPPAEPGPSADSAPQAGSEPPTEQTSALLPVAEPLKGDKT